MYYNTPYQPQRPCAGRYLIRIMEVRQEEGSTVLYYDIAVGPSAGYAYIFYLQTGKWPLVWQIRTKGGQTVLQHALRALNGSGQPPLSTIYEAAGRNLTVDIGLYNDRYLDVRRSYPANVYTISPDDIRVGTTGWSAGTRDFVHAMLLAHLSGLPVLCCDSFERGSPMVDWCAENQIAVLPSKFPAGDYTAPNSDIIVDRKADLAELYRDFAASTDRASYENAACYAAAMGKRLVYMIGTSPEDGVSRLEDLRQWSGKHPKIKDGLLSGSHLYEQLIRYKCIHHNTDFLFVPNEKLCETNYRAVRQPTVSVPARRILSA